VQSQVRFNRIPEKLPEKVPKVPEKVPEKVTEKVPEMVGKALVQSQVRFNRVPEKVLEKVPGSLGAKFKAKSGLSLRGSGEGCRSQARSGLFNSRKPS
jgi:hypothetical protein